MIKVQNLSYAIKGRPVLNDVSFTLERGEIVGLLGKNGAGKSTLLRLLSGIYPLQQGTIEFDGELVAGPGQTVSSAMRKQIGVVFQEPSVDSRLSAYRNLWLIGNLYGVSSEILSARITDGLKNAELENRAYDPVRTFSGGMRRRLELLRALLPKPTCLLLDEPSTGLDAAAFAQWWELLLKEREQGTTVFLVTHRVDEAERCDRLLVVHGGKIVAQGTPDALKAQVADDYIELSLDLGLSTKAIQNHMRHLQMVCPAIRFNISEQSICAYAPDGPALIPQLVHALPSGDVHAVFSRKPTLTDAFLRVTGSALE